MLRLPHCRVPGALMDIKTVDPLKALARDEVVSRVLRRILWALEVLAVLTAAGTAGFCLISGGQSTVSDCLYMTLISITTVGYGEVVPLPDLGGRLFAGFISFAGFGVLTFIFSSITVLFLEHDLDETARRRRMIKAIKNLKGHYIICGYGRVGRYVAREMAATARAYVVVDTDALRLEEGRDKQPDLLFLHGDASDEEVLHAADVADAKGVFAVTGDDARNLMICLTVKHMNPRVRVVARCHETRNIEKMRKAGADAVVSPDLTGGLRIASVMVRPQVVSFLDDMLRSEQHMRVEEVEVPAHFVPRALGAWLPTRSGEFLLMAVRDGQQRHFNPADNFEIRPGCWLIVMAAPEGRAMLERRLASGS
jgi:voltage-gated potassium channel